MCGNYYYVSFHFHFVVIIAFQRAIGRNTVSLEDSIPLSFLQSYTQLLFVVDHFSDIINNYRTFQIRKGYGLEDMILDTHGNVIYLSDPRA